MSTSINRWFCVALYSGNGLYAKTISNGEKYAVRVEVLSTGRTRRYNFADESSALAFASLKTID